MPEPKPKHALVPTVRARVVSNYGSHLPGSIVEVTEKEYQRLREEDGAGGYRFPVLISQADADALAAMARESEEQAHRARVAADTDRATSEGWAEHQRRAAELFDARRVEDQRRRHAILIGGEAPVIDPAEQQRRFDENVRAGRGA